MNVSLVLRSSNEKTGKIPVSTTDAGTCPDTCPLKNAGCYAKTGRTRVQWDKVTRGEAGGPWKAFLRQVATLPEGQLWRHNQAGDLPGQNVTIDVIALAALVEANRGRRGFTYTHKPMTTKHHREAVRRANEGGFTINLSANTLTEADGLAALGIGPVVVVLDKPEGRRYDLATPAGRRVVTCPATYRDDVTCKSCQLCQRQSRKVIVGFPAHGQQWKAAAKVAGG